MIAQTRTVTVRLERKEWNGQFLGSQTHETYGDMVKDDLHA